MKIFEVDFYQRENRRIPVQNFLLSLALKLQKVATHKSNISGLESSNYNPSLDFLIKLAQRLGKDLKIKLHGIKGDQKILSDYFQ